MVCKNTAAARPAEPKSSLGLGCRIYSQDDKRSIVADFLADGSLSIRQGLNEIKVSAAQVADFYSGLTRINPQQYVMMR